MKQRKLESILTDLVHHILEGQLVGAYVKYYHKQAWLPKREPFPPLSKGMKENKHLSTSKATNVYLQKKYLTRVQD